MMFRAYLSVGRFYHSLVWFYILEGFPDGYSVCELLRCKRLANQLPEVACPSEPDQCLAKLVWQWSKAGGVAVP